MSAHPTKPCPQDYGQLTKLQGTGDDSKPAARPNVIPNPPPFAKLHGYFYKAHEYFDPELPTKKAVNEQRKKEALVRPEMLSKVKALAKSKDLRKKTTDSIKLADSGRLQQEEGPSHLAPKYGLGSKAQVQC